MGEGALASGSADHTVSRREAKEKQKKKEKQKGRTAEWKVEKSRSRRGANVL